MSDKKAPDFKAIAAQLARPEGEQGLEAVALMNQNNAFMNRVAIDLLQCEADDRVLEIGPANGRFAPYILQQAKGVQYTGADISETMVNEARRLNAADIESGRTHFVLFDGNRFPFDDHSFDKAVTVNTVYFWQDPARQLKEIHRVLKPDGVLSLALGSRAFMEKLPFTRYGFTLYSLKEVTTLLEKHGFIVADVQTKQETARSNTGEVIEKELLFVRAITM